MSDLLPLRHDTHHVSGSHLFNNKSESFWRSERRAPSVIQHHGGVPLVPSRKNSTDTDTRPNRLSQQCCLAEKVLTGVFFLGSGPGIGAEHAATSISGHQPGLAPSAPMGSVTLPHGQRQVLGADHNTREARAAASPVFNMRSLYLRSCKRI